MRLDQYEHELVAIAQEIVHYLMKSGVSKEESHDVTQDVFVKMLEGRFVLPRDKIRAWMYRVAIRLYIDRYRREKRYRDILKEEFFKGNIYHLDQEDTSELYNLVQELPDKYQLPLELFYFQDFSVKEIGHILSISQSKVKIDLMRGRHQLKKIIEERGLTYEDLITL